MASCACVFAPSLDQDEVTRSETVAPSQGDALDRDAGDWMLTETELPGDLRRR